MEAPMMEAEAKPKSPEEIRAEKLKKAGMQNVELRFVTASGKFSNKSTWRADLPPTMLTETAEFRSVIHQ